MGADLLRKSVPARCCQVPETLAVGDFGNMATPVLVSHHYQLQQIFRLACFQHCLESLLPGGVWGNVPSWPRRILSHNNSILCFGPKPRGCSSSLIAMLGLLSCWEHTGVVGKGSWSLLKPGYLSCSLLRLAGASCQQQLFLNCTDTYLVLTPQANINVFLQI